MVPDYPPWRKPRQAGVLEIFGTLDPDISNIPHLRKLRQRNGRPGREPASRL